MAAQAACSPLQDLFGDILNRLEACESKLGLKPAKAGSSAPATSTSHASPTPPAALQVAQAGGGGEVPSVKAYDAYVKASLVPFVQTCDELKGLQDMGSLIAKAWDDVRAIIVLASRAKAPANVAEELAPFLAPTQETVGKIRSVKFDRDFDRHFKAVNEMLPCLSWILMRPPQQLPTAFVKEALSSTEFWTNRIRKDFKDKSDLHVAFCNNMKAALVGLVNYIEEHHKAGLTWNPKGLSVAEAAIRLTDEASTVSDDSQMDSSGHPRSPKGKRNPMLKMGSTRNVGGLVAELGQRKNADGTSAATGLRKVTKDQQTWRKEFKKAGEPAELPAAPKLVRTDSSKKVGSKKTPLRGIPIFEYQDRGFKWVIENHTADTSKELLKNGVMTIDIGDAKQQVYVYNCDGITLKVNGKFKSLILDSCTKTNVVYDTLISSAEVVNCKKLQLQVTGICPVFTIDKTIGFLVYLSAESAKVSAFTTSLSAEMNVSFPDGEDHKEVPIPEQFVHRVGNGTLTSEVSDLYH